MAKSFTSVPRRLLSMSYYLFGYHQFSKQFSIDNASALSNGAPVNFLIKTLQILYYFFNLRKEMNTEG